MEGKNKPDNLEKFFQQILGEHEEDPGVDFWDRIAPNIPEKPVATAFVYKGWMISLAFLGGLLLSSLFFYGQLNTQLLATLEAQIIEKNNQIEVLQQKVKMLQVLNESKKTDLTTVANTTEKGLVKKKEIIQQYSISSPEHIGSPEKAKLSASAITDKEPLIKLEIARKTEVASTTSTLGVSSLQPFYAPNFKDLSKFFLPQKEYTSITAYKIIAIDNQLVMGAVQEKEDKTFEAAANLSNSKQNGLDLLPIKNQLKIIFEENNFELSSAERIVLSDKSKKPIDFKIGEDELTSFIAGTLNPFSGYKYRLDGFQPNGGAISESAGVMASWNWSVYGGFETKSKWSVQIGLDFNKLIIVKESINNIRFKAQEANVVNGGYVYSFNQRSDGALGQVSVSATIFNQHKNDGEDILDGDLFKLAISTEQPVKIIRVPIMGGYRFDLSKRFYATPKLGFSAVWKIKDQTQLREVSTFSERLSLQNSGIFLTTKTTTESLEAIFRTEFGFRWRKRWYLIAEPRFKYSGKALFQYNNLELKDAPFHLMVGIRFNVD